VEHSKSVIEAIAVVGPQLRIAQSEIGRMRGIIDNASSELMVSFSEIQSAVQRRSEPQLATADAALARAITALQFQDMVGQLMSGLSERLGTASSMLDNVSGPVGESPVLPAFPRQVVFQHDVGSGEVELF
jgi:hypothetical protein